MIVLLTANLLLKAIPIVESLDSANIVLSVIKVPEAVRNTKLRYKRLG